MLFQSHSTAIFLALDIFKNVKSLFEKTIYLLKKNQSLNILRILPIQSHALAILLPLAIFKKLKSFFEWHM